MRPRTLAILAALVLGLGALVYFTEEKIPSTDERAARAKRLVDVEADEVVALELDWQGAKVRFERDAPPPVVKEESAALPGAVPPARPWRIVSPFAQRADDAAVARLLSTLVALQATRDVEGVDRAAVGLEPRRGALLWRSARGEGLLEIGAAVPASHDIVVAASGRRDFAVAPDAIVADLSRPAGEWRSREVLAAGRDRIERIAITPASGAPTTVLVKSGESLRIESPVADAADRELTDKLFTDLSALRMETFLDPPYSPEVTQALAAPAGALDLTISGDAAPLHLAVGSETAAGKRVFRVGDQAFESASQLATLLARPVEEWRSRNWTRFENWRIERARIESPAGSFELRRSDGDWLRDGQKIPFGAASDLLYALTSARAERLSAAPAGESAATPPRLTVTLSDADGNEERLTLLAVVAGESAVQARTSGRDVVLWLPASAVAEFETKVGAARTVAVETADAPKTPGS